MGSITEAVFLEVQRRPFLFRNALDLLRRWQGPVAGTGKLYVVLGADRVREVLKRPADFLSGPIYAPRLKLGPLILGMDVSPRYRKEHEILGRALSRADFNFETRVGQHAVRVLKGLNTKRRIDLVTEVIEPVFIHSLCDLFGIIPDEATSKLVDGRGATVVAQWMRKVGGLIASSVPAPFGLDWLTDGLKDEMSGFFSDPANHRETSLFTTVKETLGPQSVVRCVGGMLLPAATLFKAATLAIQKLLNLMHSRKPPDTPAFRQLKDGSASWELIQEALRFQPPIPMLVRYCPRPTTLGSKSIPPGSTVFVSLLSAMFDPQKVQEPEKFSVGRPKDAYVLFGVGPHECIAQHLAETGLPSLIGILFGNFAMEPRHEIVYDGPAVAEYKVDVTLRTGVTNAIGSYDNWGNVTDVRRRDGVEPPQDATGTR